jgi:hypothetical protein
MSPSSRFATVFSWTVATVKKSAITLSGQPTSASEPAPTRVSSPMSSGWKR